MLLKGEFSKDGFWIKCLLALFFSVLGFFVWLSINKIIHSATPTILQLQLSQFVFALLGLTFPALAIGYLLNKKPASYLRLNTFSKGILIVFPILIMVFIQPSINLFLTWNEQLHLPENLAKLEEAFRSIQQMNKNLTIRLLSGKSFADLLANLFFLALIPAVCEELFFRGAIQQLLGEKMSKHTAIWITAILFSAYHLEFFGFFPRILLGAVLGYLVLYSNSLYMSMIGHFTNNALIVIYFFISSTGIISIDIDQIGTGNQWWLSFISLLVTGTLLFTFYRAFLISKK